jgi:hypothetical protein
MTKSELNGLFYKTLFTLIYVLVDSASVFVTNRLSQPSLIFVGKTTNGTSLRWAKVFDETYPQKHSSLLRQGSDYSCKKLQGIGC